MDAAANGLGTFRPKEKTMLEAKLSVKTQQSQEFPLLVSFPQGIPVNVEDMSLLVGRKQSGKTAKTLITSSFDKVVYKGNDYGENTVKKDSCKYAVGVYDEKTKKIKLVKTDHIFVLKPHIETKDVTAPRNSTMDYATRRQSLTDEFGSRKKKRALQAEKSNTILTENISGAKSIQNILSVQSPMPITDVPSTENKAKRPRK
jgi:hypothetical protein